MTKTKKSGWIQSTKCWNCNKTGKVEDPNDSEKEIKCSTCSGTGYITTTGTLSN